MIDTASRSTAISLGAIVATLVLLVLAPAVSAAPTPSFTVAPNPPVAGQSATYTSTSTPTTGQNITKVEWDFDNNGTFEEVSNAAPWTVTHTYQTAGIKTIGIRVTDDEAMGMPATATQQVIVATRAPTAAFAFSPAEPYIGDEVLFASNSTDPDGDPLDHLWDFGDGVTSPLRNPTHAFSEPGSHTVTLTVKDPFNASDTVTRQVVVSQRPVVPGPKNEPPIARFAYSPHSPEAGKPVDFVSSAVDPEGELRSLTWDLDGDGQFDDARGEEVVYTYVKAGVRQVRLRVEDEGGLSAVDQRAVSVSAPPPPRPGFLRPDPKVQFNGLIYASGFRLKVLSVRAPRKALVTVRCKGRSCPAKQRRKRIKQRPVRFQTFERFLRAGVRLEVFITKPGTIGDYTRYAIRAGKAPKPAYGCVAASGKLRRIRCGS